MKKIFKAVLATVLVFTLGLGVLTFASGDGDVTLEDALENLGEYGIAHVTSTKPIECKELERLAELNGKLQVSVPGGSWFFNTIEHPGASFAPGMTVGCDVEIPEVTQRVKAFNIYDATMVHFDHSGNLPGTADIGIGAHYAVGTRLYFYHYNPATMSFDLQQVTVAEDGHYAVVTMSQVFGDYVLSPTPIGQLPEGIDAE